MTLAAAQAYARDHLATGTGGESDNARALEVFLSDRLVDKFPSALQDFHRLNAGLRALNQFGKHFASTLMVAGGLGILDCAVKISGGDVVNGVGEERAEALRTSIALVQSVDGDMPLSKTEQDLFHELCVIPPDWDNKENGPPGQEDEESMAMDEDKAVSPFITQHPHVVEVPEMQHIAMDVDMLAQALPPTPSTAKPDCASFASASTALPTLPRRSGHTKRSSVSSMSSLSSDSDGMTHSTSTIMPLLTKSKATVDTAVAAAAGGSKEKDKDNRPLRRSKRVADALAAMNVPQVAQPSRASRSRKGGSRNSLS